MIQLRLKKNQRLLPQAWVQIAATQERLCTGDQGELTLELPPGPHNLVIDAEAQRWELELEIPPQALHEGTVLELDLEAPEVTQPRLSLITTGGLRVRTPPRPVEVLRDRYELRELLGVGGMGRVYRAWDRDLVREVAIKFLADDLARVPEARAIFADEARAMAQVRHANLIAVFDVLRDAERPALVMEYVRGQTLEQRLDAHPGGLPIPLGLDLTAQLLAALLYLDQRAILHRDIKPSNMMVDEEGTLRLMDFGLARSLESLRSRGTQIRGTPAYMAPEQVLGEPLTPATDLYAACAALFELWTGRLLFTEGDLPFHHVYTPAPDPQSLRHDLPEPIARLLLAGLAKPPEERPKVSPGLLRELALELERRGHPLPPPRGPAAEPIRRLLDRRRAHRRCPPPRLRRHITPRRRHPDACRQPPPAPRRSRCPLAFAACCR